MSRPSSGITSAMSGRGALASTAHPPSSIHQSPLGHAKDKATGLDGRPSISQRILNAKGNGGTNLPQPVNSPNNSSRSNNSVAASRREACNAVNVASSKVGNRNTGPLTASSRHTLNNSLGVTKASATSTAANNRTALTGPSHQASLRISPTLNAVPFHGEESSNSPPVLNVPDATASVNHTGRSGIPSPTAGSNRMGLQPLVNGLKASKDSENAAFSESNGVHKESSSERCSVEDPSSKLVPSTNNGASRLAPPSVPSSRTAIPNGPVLKQSGPGSVNHMSKSMGATTASAKTAGNRTHQGSTSPRGGLQRINARNVSTTLNSSSSTRSIWSKGTSSTSQSLQNGHSNQQNGVVVRPRVVTVIRNGSSRPRRVVRILLNRRTAPCFNSALSALTHAVKLDSGAVRKVFTLDGTQVTCLEDFFREDDIFMAYGSERYSKDDLHLDLEELKSVLQLAKSSTSLKRLGPLRPASPGRMRRDADGYISRECTGSSLGGGGGVSRRTTAQVHPGMPPKTKPQRRRPGVTNAQAKSHLPGHTATGKSRLPTGSAATNSKQSSGNRSGVSEVEFLEISSSECGSAGGSGSGVVAVQEEVDDEEGTLVIPEEISQKYDVGRIIGDGNFAVVRECTERETRTKYALKVIDRSKCRGREQLVESEVSVLRRVSHPNIVGLFAEFHSPSELYLVLELVKGGDLFDAIASASKFTEDVAKHMIRDLCSALCYLHSLQIVHRDIKPENLLVLEEGNINEETRLSLKLGDFGLAQVVNEPLFTVCGTPTYVAPEILAETGYGLKVDIWAAGVIAYILLCGFPPFVSVNNDQEELFDRILRGHFSFPTPHWDHISKSARDLVSHMLRVDPEIRFSAEDVLDHPWVPLADDDIGNGNGGNGDPNSGFRARVYEELGVRFDGQLVDVDQHDHCNSRSRHGGQSVDDDYDDDDGDEDDDDDDDDDDDEEDAKLLSSTESQQCYHALEVV